MNLRFALATLMVCSAALSNFGAEPSPSALSSGYAEWKNGPSANEDFFPIAVWLQDPANAARYKAAGINLYVGLWRGPTANQLEQLNKAGMRVICSQNRFALEQRDNPVIAAWMHGDEPDNAQSLGDGKGWGPPIPAERIVRDYERIRANDPSRPVLLNLGQGVAWDNWIGRGVRRNHPEDYPEYVKGCDIASFDIYPVVHDSPEVKGRLEFVAAGVKRLVAWAGPERLVWNCVECTHISNPNAKATPAQVRSEVWIALIHGSRGLIYFVHQFKPVFREAALLDDPEMLAGVTAINRRIQELAPVLNSPSVLEGVTVKADKAEISAGLVHLQPIAWMQKRSKDATYLFTVNMRNESARASFSLAAASPDAAVDVLDEDRQVSLKNREFTDEFKPYEAHLYRIPRL